MFDYSTIPTVDRVFKEYSLTCTGNANFLTITCEKQDKAKLFAVSNAIPLNESVQLVCRLFPYSVVTSCSTVDKDALWVHKQPIMRAVPLLASKYYFVFPLLHNVASRGCRYSLSAPYERMPLTVKRQFSVCAFIKIGRVYFPAWLMQGVPTDLSLDTYDGRAYYNEGDEYADQCLFNEQEILDNGCKILGKPA